VRRCLHDDDRLFKAGLTGIAMDPATGDIIGVGSTNAPGGDFAPTLSSMASALVVDRAFR